MIEYFNACSMHGEGIPCRLQEFLPWNMSPEQIQRYMEPTPVHLGDMVFPSSAACSDWTREQIAAEDELRSHPPLFGNALMRL